ncbi:MAG: dnaJ protein 1-like [Chitinophagaceae bacterium]|nr:dnaJ protein 1-like [Chitinophagaceae bacterium]
MGVEGTSEDILIGTRGERSGMKTYLVPDLSSLFLLSTISYIYHTMSTYYDILCVPQQASEDEIRKAYRKQALLFHPDRNSSADATARFLMILQAYEVLSDKNKRFLYDHNLGEYASGSVYDIPNYETWKAQKAEERKLEQQRLKEELEQQQTTFRNHRYYRFRKASIYIQSISGIFLGFTFLFLSLYLVFITHVIVFFVVLPFICAGFLLSYFSYTWFADKKKLF